MFIIFKKLLFGFPEEGIAIGWNVLHESPTWIDVLLEKKSLSKASWQKILEKENETKHTHYTFGRIRILIYAFDVLLINPLVLIRLRYYHVRAYGAAAWVGWVNFFGLAIWCILAIYNLLYIQRYIFEDYVYWTMNKHPVKKPFYVL